MSLINQSTLEYSYLLPDKSIETQTQISNIVTTNNITSLFTIEKSSNEISLTANGFATQTVILTNNTGKTLTNIYFKDIMRGEANYIAGSVFIDSTSQPTYNLTTGFDIDNMQNGDIVTIKYKIQANSTVSGAPITNYANVNYKLNSATIEENSNTVIIETIPNELLITKEVDKTTATNGEILHYAITVENKGSLTYNNLYFIDILDNGAMFVPNSVKVDTVAKPSLNPQTGFALPTIGASTSMIIEFDVKVI